MRKLERGEYNTVSGISSFLKHYPHFHAVLNERVNARRRDELLDKFVVLKAFSLDQFGQLGKIEPSSQIKKLMADQSDCMVANEFFAELQKRQSEDQYYGITLSPVYLPPLHTQCAGCGKYYGTDDCHNVVPWQENDVLMPLRDYVGRQLWEVRRHLDNLPDAGYFIHPSLQIRNDRFIDMNPEPYFSNYPRNQRGWIGTEDGISDWYVIQPGDETMYDHIRYFHTDCFKDWVTEETRMEFKQLFKNAGVEVVKMETRINEYGSFSYRGPWFNVETPYGIMRIGWRKRVIEIVLEGEWSVDCSELFYDEDVTKGHSMIHAWDREKASEYLKAISNAITHKRKIL